MICVRIEGSTLLKQQPIKAVCGPFVFPSPSPKQYWPCFRQEADVTSGVSGICKPVSLESLLQPSYDHH